MERALVVFKNVPTSAIQLCLKSQGPVFLCYVIRETAQSSPGIYFVVVPNIKSFT